MNLLRSVATASLLVGCHSQSLPRERVSSMYIDLGPGEVVRVRNEIYGCLTQGSISESTVHRLRSGETRQGIGCNNGNRYQSRQALQQWQFSERDGHYTICLTHPVNAHNTSTLHVGEVSDGYVCLSDAHLLTSFTTSRLVLSANIHGVRRAPLIPASGWIMPLLTMDDYECMASIKPGNFVEVTHDTASLCTMRGEVTLPMHISGAEETELPQRRTDSPCRTDCEQPGFDTILLVPQNYGFACNTSIGTRTGAIGGAQIYICSSEETPRQPLGNVVQTMHPGDWVTCGGVDFACIR